MANILISDTNRSCLDACADCAQACENCNAPLEPLWQVCPYCEKPIELTPTLDLGPPDEPRRRRSPSRSRTTPQPDE